MLPHKESEGDARLSVNAACTDAPLPHPTDEQGHHDETPGEQLVNVLLTNAIQSGVEEIRAEPYEDCLLIRRINGHVEDTIRIPKPLEPQALARLREIAGIQEKSREAQHGCSRFRLPAQDIDLRVSVLPWGHAERVVVRLLKAKTGRVGFVVPHPEMAMGDLNPGAALILVIEDDPDMMALLEVLLKTGGYRMIKAIDGVEALLCLGRYSFDLIISDIDIPQLNGFRLLDMLAQKGICTPWMFLTADHLSWENEIKAFRLGAVDYLKKPIRKGVFLARVKRALAMRHPLSST